MQRNQFISVTELRMHTKKSLENLERGEKYILVNNKPKAVLIDFDVYEKLKNNAVLHELPEAQLTSEILSKAKLVRKLPKSKLENL